MWPQCSSTRRVFSKAKAAADLAVSNLGIVFVGLSMIRTPEIGVYMRAPCSLETSIRPIGRIPPRGSAYVEELRKQGSNS